MGTLGFSGLHLLFCLLTSWVLGHDFSTVVYVTSATLLTGTVVTFTFAFLVLINVVITAFSNFSQFGQNMFGGGGGVGGIGSSGGGSQQQAPPPNIFNTQNPSVRRRQSNSRSRNIAEAALDEDVGGDDRSDIKLD